MQACFCTNMYECLQMCLLQALGSLERLDKYLWSKELEEDAVMKLPLDFQSLVVVKVECASFKWDSKKENLLLATLILWFLKVLLSLWLAKWVRESHH